jgi:hypothetical protein
MESREIQSCLESAVLEAAEGFCSWFLLQHFRGYKPFITKVTFDWDFKGDL